MSGQSHVIDSIPGNIPNNGSQKIVSPNGGTVDICKLGQSFTGNGMPVTEAQFYVNRVGVSVGDVWYVAKIYASTGTFGVDDEPTGQPLATSESILLNNVSTTAMFVSFFFTGNNVFTPVAGGHYFIVLECESPGIFEATTPYYLIARVVGSSYSNGGRSVRFDGRNAWFYYNPLWHVSFQVLSTAKSVLYDANGATGGNVPVDSNSPYVSGSTVTVLGNTGNLVKSGYSFLGWATSSSATNAQYTQGSTFTITQNTTLYAVWQQLFVVNYFANNPVSTSVTGTVPTDNNTYVAGATVTVKPNSGNLAVTGYVFLGWEVYGEPSPPTFAVVGNTVTPSTFIMGSSNVNLYGVWQQSGGGGGLTVTYDANWPKGLPGNGEVPIDGASYSSGNFVYVKTNPSGLSKAGYALLGWAYSSSASSPNFQVTGGSFTYPQGFAIAGNTVLYAVWDWGLFEAGTIKAYEDVFVNNKVLPFEKWVNDTPTPSNPGNKVLNVDIGSTAWPFRYIHGLELKTDYVVGLTSTDLTLKPYAGKKLNLDGNVYIDGDVEITGTLTGGGAGSGGTFNGGTITNPIQLMHKFIVLEGEKDMLNFMFPEWGNPPHPLPAQLGYTLHDTATGNFNRIFGAISKNPYVLNDAGSPGVALTHHLFVRGDFQVRGMIDSKEGVFVAHGGPKLLGWGPEGIGNIPTAKRNPMLLIKNDLLDGNTAPDTWETRILTIRGTVLNPLIEYSWANLATNNLLCHGFIGTDYLSTLSGSGNITLNNSLVPFVNHTNSLGQANPDAVDLGSYNFAYREIYALNGRFASAFASLGVTTPDIYSGAVGRPNSYIRYRDTSGINMITLDGNVTVTGTLNASAANPFNQSLNTSNSVQFVNVTATGNIVPASNLTGSVGLYGQMWNNGYIQNIYASMLQATTSVNTDTIYGVSSNNNNGLLIQTYNNGSYPLRIRASNVVPFANLTSQLGTSATMWGSSYIQNMYGSFLQVTTGINTDAINSTSATTLRIHAYHGSPQNIEFRAANIMPYSSGYIIVGSQSNYFAGMWMGTCGYKNLYSFGCERSKSGQVWEPLFKSAESALKVLSHEVKKTVHHITYSDVVEDELICVCGKSVKRPCPECEDEWLDRYCKNTGERNEAASFLTLEHVAVLAKMQNSLDEANKRIVALEKKLSANKGVN